MPPKFVSGRSTIAVMDIDLPKNIEGVLYALGGISSGFTVYMDKGILNTEYNAMTLNS
jgi:arylsulfatase